MFRTFCIALLLITPIALLAKPPGRDITPKADAPKKFVPPSLDGYSNWGYVYHAKGNVAFSLKGHPLWSAEGRFRDDGKVVIIWTNLANDDIAPGVYTLVIVDGLPELRGEWGYAGAVEIDEAGNITGEVRSDRVVRVPPPEPEI